MVETQALSATKIEPLKSPEFSTSNKPVALQMRLFMGGEALVYPKKDVKAVTVDSATRENTKNKSNTLKRLGVTASYESKEEWSKGEKAKLKHNEQVSSWAKEVDKVFKTEGAKPHQDKLKNITLGGINLSEINEQTALRLYDRYFRSSDSEAANIKRFVDDLTAVADYQTLENNLSSLTFLAGMFGKNTSALLHQYLTAYIKFNKNPQSQTDFINEVNEKDNKTKTTSRVDWLNPEEDRLFKWFHEKSNQIKVITIEQTKPTTITTTESKPKKAKTETPWDNIPKPDQPVKIKEKKDISMPNGLGVFHQRETYLILGTKDHPLVTEEIKDDGSKTKHREINPERPYQIPIGFYFDNDVTAEQKLIIQNSLPAIFTELGTPQNFVFNGEMQIAKIMNEALRSSPRKDRNQIDTSVIHDIFRMTNQHDKPHNIVVITNKDMYFGENNFVIGAANADEGTIISLARIWNSIKDPQLRNQVVATEIAHEVGHVYNLPSDRRGAEKIENSLGGHCKSPGCCMKQGLSVPADWITITQDRLTHLKDHFFCEECRRDLQEKFKRK